MNIQKVEFIYAFLDKIFIELFNSKPLDYKRDDIPEYYARSMEIVKNEGYENIVSSYHNNLG